MRAEVINLGVNEINRVWINSPVGMLCITLEGLDTVYVTAHHIPKDKILTSMYERAGFAIVKKEDADKI